MPDKKLKYLLVVQGEGRGHMTQAISISQILTQAGHEVCAVLVGKSKRRQIPSFFYERINAPVFSFDSPNFVLDNKNKSVKIFSTIVENVKRSGHFLKNLREIDKRVNEYKPDVIINFYDLLCGMYFLIYKPKIEYICIGHQYLLLHNQFKFPERKKLDRFLVQMNTHMTSFRATKKLALSFRQLPPDDRNKVFVVPPLLRKEIFSIEPQQKPFFLAYMVNDGYAEEIMKWHKNHPDVEVHCFWDRKDAQDVTEIHPNLFFHRINDKKFLELMSSCKAYASTAGFESICEAMYLGKPVLMVPAKGQFEQECNAIDAVESYAGITKGDFDLSSLLEFVPKYRGPVSSYKNWVKMADSIFLKELSGIEPVNVDKETKELVIKN